MLYHVSSHMSIQLFDILSVGNVVNSQNTPSVYFCVYVYGIPPSGSRIPYFFFAFQVPPYW